MSKIYFNVKIRRIFIDHQPTRYLILSCGSVYNETTGSFMKGGADKNGYHIVSLSLNGKKYTRKIHRLVAEYFIPNPNNLPEVNHIDGDKWNNEDCNLEWVSSAENTHHAARLKLRKSLLTESDVVKVCELLEKSDNSISEISDLTGVPKSSILKIRRGDNWRSISTKYKISKAKLSRANHGENNGNSSITAEDAVKICKLLKSGKTPTEVSKSLNISRRIIYSIKNGGTWKTISVGFID